jgi:hypothetical protein
MGTYAKTNMLNTRLVANKASWAPLPPYHRELCPTNREKPATVALLLLLLLPLLLLLLATICRGMLIVQARCDKADCHRTRTRVQCSMSLHVRPRHPALPHALLAGRPHAATPPTSRMLLPTRRTASTAYRRVAPPPTSSVFLPWRYRQTWRYRHWTSGNRQRLKFQIIATAVGTIATLSPRMRRAIATFSIIAMIATIKNTT